MKQLILSLALCFAAVAGFAQEASDPNQLLNEGKTALEARNYQEAFDKLSAYLTQTNDEDSVIAFNCGVCADKIKKPAEAAKYFDIAIKKNYNLVNSYIGKVGALKDLKQNDEYVAALKEAMTAVPDNKATFEKMYVNFYLTQGVAAQKAKNTDAAAAAFKEVLAMQPQTSTLLMRSACCTTLRVQVWYRAIWTKLRLSLPPLSSIWTSSYLFFLKATPHRRKC